MSIFDIDVKAELEKLDIYKSSGPDNIHPKLLKFLSNDASFVSAVGNLYRKCSEEQKIPQVWKQANITALHKQDSKTDPANYRPISLTSILCKIYERFVRHHVLPHVEGDLSEHQHGFVSGKSCLSNLLETVDCVIELLSVGAPVDILYLDFCKAFDTVPHYRLLAKLESFGITGSTLNIIRDFLTDRTMQVVVNGKHSETIKVVSGVPQGSVLGPLLFVLFINDLPHGIKSDLRLFADDLKLIVNAQDHINIENDLNLLERWGEMWLLQFNPTKCKCLRIDGNDNPENIYEINNVEVKVVESECDLGLHTNSHLTWDDHIKESIKKANKMIAWIVRNIISREEEVMLLLYKTIIRPHLEYCVQVWSPAAHHGSWSMIIDLEKIQKKFTRLINGIGLLPYSERLATLKLTTLAERRLRGDLIETYKISNGIVDYGKNLFKWSRSGSNIVSRTVCGRKNALRQNFFSQRVHKYWNLLPLSVKKAKNINQFKNNLLKFKESNIYVAGNYWEVSDVLMEKIEPEAYLNNKKIFNEYVLSHPNYAKRHGFNTR